MLCESAIRQSPNRRKGVLSGDGSEREGSKARADSVDDGVLQRLLSLRKGRDLLARALALAVPAQVLLPLASAKKGPLSLPNYIHTLGREGHAMVSVVF